MRNRILFFLLTMLAITHACTKKDFDYKYPAPAVLFDGNVAARTVVPGAEIRIRYTIQAVSEAAKLTITQSVNNATATQVSEITNFTDPLLEARILNYTVPNTVAAGQTVVLNFILQDKRGKTSDTAKYTLSVVGAQFTQTTQIICGQEVTVLGPPPGNTVTIINLNDFTFQANRRYLITGFTTFEDGNRVILEAGTTIYGQATPRTQQGATVFVIPAGCVIDARGTKENPVVFTSSHALGCTGTPEPGDWQGIDIRGQFNTNPNFSSGTLRYIRCEYGGRDFTDNQTTGNIRLSNLTSATTVEYIQSFKAFGNAIRINGGNVNIRYAIAVDQLDNGFRCDDFQLPSGASIPGWTGNGQFWISVNNFVRDNSELEIRDGCNASFANLTLIGRGGTIVGSDDGIRIRNTATGYRIFNMILSQIPDDGVRGELGNPTNLSGNRVIGHSALFAIRDQIFRDNVGVFNQPAYNNSFTAIAGIGVNSFVPTAVPTSTFNPTTLNAWFLPALFTGAVQNAATDWTADGSWCKNSDGTIR